MKPLFLLSFILCSLVCACGGGTSGSSVSGGSGDKAFVGIIKDEGGEPVFDAEITVSGETESHRTDTNGKFLVTAGATNGESSFVLSVENISLPIQLVGLKSDHSVVMLNIVFDRRSHTITVEQIELLAVVEGFDCAPNFSSAEIVEIGPRDVGQERQLGYIEQEDDLPAGTVCTVRLKAYRNGAPYEGFVIDARDGACFVEGDYSTGVFDPLALVTTDQNGEAQFSFTIGTIYCRSITISAPAENYTYEQIGYGISLR